MIAAPRWQTEPIGPHQWSAPGRWIESDLTPSLTDYYSTGTVTPGPIVGASTAVFIDDDLLTRVLTASDPFTFGRPIDVTYAPRAYWVIMFGIGANTIQAGPSYGHVDLTSTFTASNLIAGSQALHQFNLSNSVTASRAVLGGHPTGLKDFIYGAYVGNYLQILNSGWMRHRLLRTARPSWWPWLVDEPAVEAFSQPAPLLPRDREEEAVAAKSGRVVNAVNDLQEWLGVSLEGVAEMVGSSKSAILYWKREDSEPRPAVSHRLMRVHALVRALRRGRSDAEFWTVLHSPRPSGSGSLLDLLLAGKYSSAEAEARRVLFGGTGETRSGWTSRTVGLPEDDEPVTSGRREVARTPLKKNRRLVRRRSG